MNILKRYLEHLSGKTESIFPMDSVHTGKPFDVARVSEKKKKKKIKNKVLKN